MSHPPSASLLLCLCSSEVLFEAHTSVEHGSRLVAVLFPSTKFPPTGRVVHPKIHPFSSAGSQQHAHHLPCFCKKSNIFVSPGKQNGVASEKEAGAGVQTQNDSGGKNCAMFTKFCSEKVEK